jgi:tetratricopeptide (TPR) repeat protein
MRTYLIIAVLLCLQQVFAQDPPAKYQDIWMQINMDPEGSAPIRQKLEQLRKENPKDPWIFWISGISCNPITGKAEAAVFYRQAIAADPTFPHAYYNLASLNEDTSEAALRETIELYTKAVTYDQSLGFAYLSRGDAYFQLGEYDLALADCGLARKCSDFDPLAADALELEILWAQHKKKEAYALIRQADFNAGMWGTDFDLLRASIFEDMGDHAGACACYQKAAEIYEMMEEELPVKIAEGLKGCK